MKIGATFEFRSDHDIRGRWFTKIIVEQGDSATKWKIGVKGQDPTCRKPVLTFSSNEEVIQFVNGKEVEVMVDYLYGVPCRVRNYHPPPSE
jgi:hypothetical protein